MSSQQLDLAMAIQSNGRSFLRLSCSCSCVSGAQLDQQLGDSRLFGGLSFPHCKNQILSTLSPNRVLTMHVNGAVLDKDTQHKVLKYLATYVLIVLALVFIVSLDNNNLMTVVSGVLSCFNNIGPMIGTTDTFSIFSPFSKLLLAFAMIGGRLEIYPILLLFLPKTWSRR